jgi:hypothetical protein
LAYLSFSRELTAGNGEGLEEVFSLTIENNTRISPCLCCQSQVSQFFMTDRDFLSHFFGHGMRDDTRFFTSSYPIRELISLFSIIGMLIKTNMKVIAAGPRAVQYASRFAPTPMIHRPHQKRHSPK